MSESFHIDPDAVRALTAELRGIAERAARTARDLQDALAAAGMTETTASWGDDEMGRAFAEYYVPSADEGVGALESSAGALHQMGDLFAESLSAFENLDNAGAGSVRDAAAAPEPAVPDTGAAAPTDRILPPANFPPAHTPARTSGYDPDPGMPTGSPAAIPGGDDAVEPSTSAPRAQPATEASEPVTDTAAGPVNRRHDESLTPPGPAVPTRPATGPVRTEAPPGQAPSGAGRPAPGDRSAARSPWSGHISAAQTPTEGRRAPASPPNVSAPPQQGSTPRATPPDHPGGAPRGTPPGRRDDRKNDQRPAAVTPKPHKTSPQPVRVAPQPVTDSAVLRIIEELGARYGLRIIGFDTAGLDEPTAREIAAAVDQVLERHHTIDLRGLEIADLDDALPARLERPVVSGADQPETRAAHIVLDRAATTDPATRAASISVATGGRRPAPGCTERPLYANLIRELGRALAAEGDYAAHRLTQRTLIAEYLRIAGPEHASDPLGRIVGGYRHWRDRLSGCSPTARFDPAAALVEAFTEVELRADRASAPAVALHQLLVDTARQKP
ncbi:WXG100 family type VII secretion target [Nocardia fusca]|uniref:WXG100 family type VII secretion target n=1 Tax=Nocardia fusca TaxID=941183 RepID=A0ABV3F2K5_9NOCA